MNAKIDNLKRSVLKLREVSEVKKRLFFYYLSDILKKKEDEIIAANQKDLQNSKLKGVPNSFIERLSLEKKDLEELRNQINKLAKEEQVVGKIVEEKKLQNGIRLQKMRVPIGVVLVIYEARPEVTLRVVSLCLKSSNAVILHPGSEIEYTNNVLFSCITHALKQSSLPVNAVVQLKTDGQTQLFELLKRNDLIDLVIARGGNKLVRRVLQKSSIPVIAHVGGGARVFVDKTANQHMALKIIGNGKLNKLYANNSIDTILVHTSIANKFIPLVQKELQDNHIQILIQTDWNKELLGPQVGLQVVKDVAEAISWIRKYTKYHTEVIISESKKSIDQFVSEIDSASVMVNCSPRLHNGSVYGMGTDAGIATGKLHVRGPVGFRELTSYKWIALGKGQIRE